MSYKRAEDVLPKEMIQLIQKYIDGENIYIPRKDNQRRQWGTSTTVRKELRERNQQIYYDYRKGLSKCQLAGKYYLSEKSIQRILREKQC